MECLQNGIFCQLKPAFLGQQDPWRRAWLPTPVFMPGEFHGQRSLVGYCLWDRKEWSDQHFEFHGDSARRGSMVKNLLQFRRRGFSPTGGASGEEPACQRRSRERLGFHPCLGKMPWRRRWQPTPVFLPGESQGQRTLVDYSPMSQMWLKWFKTRVHILISKRKRIFR